MKKTVIFAAILILFSSVYAQQRPSSSGKIKPVQSIMDGAREDTSITSPRFPGGDNAYFRFLARNLKRPNQDDVFGRVYISFFVEKDGHLTELRVERSLKKDFDAEAIRVLKKSPRWIPAKRDGKFIRIKYIIPINFSKTTERNEK